VLKLTARLAAIDTMAGTEWQHIWDCCCDHGQLGMRLLERDAGQLIHFVDVVPELVAQVEQTLVRFAPDQSRWQVHCDDVASLVLPDAQRQLVIIAGVGGDLTLALVQGILAANPRQPINFILCPVRQHYLLRTELASAGLALVDEQLLEENGRFYEILHLTTGEGKLLSGIGDQMWDFSNPRHCHYLQRTLAHYQRQAQGQPAGMAPAVAAYQALLHRLKET